MEPDDGADAQQRKICFLSLRMAGKKLWRRPRRCTRLLRMMRRQLLRNRHQRLRLKRNQEMKAHQHARQFFSTAHSDILSSFVHWSVCWAPSTGWISPFNLCTGVHKPDAALVQQALTHSRTAPGGGVDTLYMVLEFFPLLWFFGCSFQKRVGSSLPTKAA